MEEEDKEEEWEDEHDPSESFHLELSERQAIESASVRPFKVHNIYFEAKTFPELLDWNKGSFSEPPMGPMIMSLSREEVLAFVDEPMLIGGYTCHTADSYTSC